MGLALVGCRAFDVGLELLHEVIKSQVFLLFLFLLDACLGFLYFDLINDIKSATILSLKIRPAQLEHSSLLLAWLEEAISNMRHDVLFLDLFEVARNFHAQGRSVFAHAHKFFNLLQVVLSAVVLVLFEDLNVGAAVPLPHMLDEV